MTRTTSISSNVILNTTKRGYHLFDLILNNQVRMKVIASSISRTPLLDIRYSFALPSSLTPKLLTSRSRPSSRYKYPYASIY